MKKKLVKMLSVTLSAVMLSSLVACSGGQETNSSNATSSNDSNNTETSSTSSEVPSIDKLKVGEDFKDINASIKVLTNRTDIVDTIYKGYAEQFMEIYPNIKVEYEGITDYEQSLQLRLATGDWGDICFIPTSVSKNELENYFIPLGDYNTLDSIYNFCQEKAFNGKVYGIANGGTANGVIYNKDVWAKAGITEMPKTPDEFLADLQLIKEKTTSIPLYTNFAAGWTMGAWDAYIDIAATGDPDFKNNMPHMANPFAKREDMTGPYAVYYTLYEAVARKLIEDDPASTDWESSKGAIGKGDIATMVLGSWAVEQCKEVTKNAGNNPDAIGYMPFPITVNGKQYAGASGNYGFGINNKASVTNQQAALTYLKWLIEESPIYTYEGSIPALKGESLPDALSDFQSVELLSNNMAPEGEEDLFDDLNSESEVGINTNDYKKSEIVEGALYGTRKLDEILQEWNEDWSKGQQKLGIEVNK